MEAHEAYEDMVLW